MPPEFDPLPFHLDHIRPQKHGGATTRENLALSCAACSLYKEPNAAGYDPETDFLCQLCNPRAQVWNDQFRWFGSQIVGRTDIDRTTIEVLRIHKELRVHHREVLIELGIFPPTFPC